MKRTPFLLALLTPMFGGCSYTYDLKAIVIGGRLAFIVDPKSESSASCIKSIDVIARGNARAKPAPGDDVSRVEYGTFWHAYLDTECLDEFPILYGQPLKGKPRPLGDEIETVSAKPVKIGVIYDVAATSRSSGYGGGAFKILPDHTVINVPRPPMIDPGKAPEPVNRNGT